MLDRSAKIYGIIFGSIALFLLIFTGATHVLYRNKIVQKNHSYIESMNIEYSSYSYHSVNQRFVKRAIYGEKESYEWDSDPGERVLSTSWLLLLEVVEYGLPLKLLALYDNDGMLQGVEFASNHILGDMVAGILWDHYYVYIEDPDKNGDAFKNEKGLMSALIAGSHYVKEQGR